MSKASYNKTKGNKFEKEILEEFRGRGHDVQRVVASGAVVEEDADIVLRLGKVKKNMECKFHKTLPTATLDKWRGDDDILIMRKNNGNPFVYMDLETLLVILDKYLN